MRWVVTVVPMRQGLWGAGSLSHGGQTRSHISNTYVPALSPAGKRTLDSKGKPQLSSLPAGRPR